MKILQINNCHFRRGGADIVYINTGELLTNYGNDVSYFSVKNKFNIKTCYSKYFVNSVNYFPSSFLKRVIKVPRFFYSFEAARKLQNLLRNCRPDIAHVHLYKGGLTSSILWVLKKNKIPILVTLHDYGFIDPHNLLLDGNLNISESTINGSAFNCFFQRSNRNSYFLSLISTMEYLFHSIFFPFDKSFDSIIAVSLFSKFKHLESKKFNWSIDHLYNFSPLLDKNIVTFANKNSYLLFFGRLSKEKGVETLIDAISILSSNVLLKIVGSGELEEKLKDIISKRKLSNIEMLGYKNGDELYNLIKLSSFVVVPSKWYENNPMTIIESYSFGVPVIGSRVGGIPEIIQEDITGFTFKMGDASDLARTISKALNLTEKEYLEMTINARRFAQTNFSPQEHYEKLMKIYNKIILKYKKK